MLRQELTLYSYMAMIALLADRPVELPDLLFIPEWAKKDKTKK